MYPEKPKRDQEKPKRHPGQGKFALSRFFLASLFFVPGLLLMLPRFNQKQFVDMLLLTVIISLSIYLVYQLVIFLLASALGLLYETEENTDFPQESDNH